MSQSLGQFLGSVGMKVEQAIGILISKKTSTRALYAGLSMQISERHM